MNQSRQSGAVRTIDRDKLVEMKRRGEPFRLVMALNQWAFEAKHKQPWSAGR